MRRLYRSNTDIKLTGVCAGIAEYLEIDPTAVRLVTVLLSLFTGFGIIAYIAGALLMPQKPY